MLSRIEVFVLNKGEFMKVNTRMFLVVVVLCGLMASGMLFVDGAKADPITYQISGNIEVVDDVNEFLSATGISDTSTFTGSFTYDSSCTNIMLTTQIGTATVFKR